MAKLAGGQHSGNEAIRSHIRVQKSQWFSEGRSQGSDHAHTNPIWVSSPPAVSGGEQWKAGCRCSEESGFM